MCLQRALTSSLVQSVTLALSRKAVEVEKREDQTAAYPQAGFLAAYREPSFQLRQGHPLSLSYLRCFSLWI